MPGVACGAAHHQPNCNSIRPAQRRTGPTTIVTSWPSLATSSSNFAALTPQNWPHVMRDTLDWSMPRSAAAFACVKRHALTARDLRSKQGFALHLGGVRVAQVGIDVGAARLDRDVGMSAHQCAPCTTSHASKSCFAALSRALIKSRSCAGVLMPLLDFF